MHDILSLVWGHSVHFAKFPILQQFLKPGSSNFCPSLSILYTRYPNHESIQAITFLW